VDVEREWGDRVATALTAGDRQNLEALWANRTAVSQRDTLQRCPVPRMSPRVSGLEPRAGCAIMSASQQDHASDEPRDDATGESTHKARGSRLMVKDVGRTCP
jgi:hypothetical protein